MPGTGTNDELYEVILIYSGVGYAAICPGITGAVSQGTDQQDALAMIADAMEMCRMYPLPGEDDPARQAELREIGKVKARGTGGRVRARRLGIRTPSKLRTAVDKPAGASGVAGCRHTFRELTGGKWLRLLRRLNFRLEEGRDHYGFSP